MVWSGLNDNMSFLEIRYTDKTLANRTCGQIMKFYNCVATPPVYSHLDKCWKFWANITQDELTYFNLVKD